MTIHLLIAVVVLGLVQGITELLPVSSSGHLILADRLLHFEAAVGGKSRVIVFEIFIQTGAIAAILAEYGRELWKTAVLTARPSAERSTLLPALVVGTIPVVLIGGLFGGVIQDYLFSP